MFVAWQQALAECNQLSCNLYNNIYGGTVQRAGFVHPLANGIGSTSVDGTRDWLLNNVIQASDDYSRDLATNMTSLLRSKYDIDDRVRKAWFINPANRWTIQSTGAQSRLLLSDRLIIFAVIVLNDGNGRIMRRRLLSFSSQDGETVPVMIPSSRQLLQQQGQQQQLTTISEQQVASLLQQISNKPRTGVMPPVDFKVSIPYTLASIYQMEHKFTQLLEVSAVGVFQGSQWTQQQVNTEFVRRILANQKLICPECFSIYQGFTNMRTTDATATAGAARRRRLLQLQTGGGANAFAGTVSVLLVYDRAPLDDSKYKVYFADVSKAVFAPTFTNIWSGTSDPAALQTFIDHMKANQFVVTTVEASGSNAVNGIQVDLVASGILPPSGDNHGATPAPTPAAPPGGSLAMDMTAFGVRDTRSIPDSGEFKPSTSDASSSKGRRGLDPMMGTIFLAASVMLFWG